MTKIQKAKGDNHLVLKEGKVVATIKKLRDGWALLYSESGRREEYDTLAEARDAALKI